MLARLNTPWSLMTTPENNLFDEVFKIFDNHGMTRSSYSLPQRTVTENESDITIKIFLPGCKAEDFDINVVSDFITISATRELDSLNEKERYLRKERSTLNYRDSFNLPSKVINSKVTASYTDGILEIVLPKEELEKPRSIKVA
jgi:HSP20 family protein